MTPNDVTPEERYGFFKMFNYYETKEGSVVHSSETGSYCDSFLSDHIFTHIISPKEFCKKFKRLYDILIISSKVGKPSDDFDDNDCSFLNYWLNDKLRGANYDSTICVQQFYQKLKSAKDTFLKSTLLETKLYNIEKHDLENMRRLYDLYNIKSNVSGAFAKEIGNEESASCLTYTKECFGKYRDAVINCRDGCSYFYSVLTEFKNKYKEEFSYYTNTSKYCKSKELFDLPDYETVIKEYKSGPFKRIITLPVLFPLLGMFFIFIFSDTVKYNTYFNLTPFRQKAFEKIKSTKNMLLGARERRNLLLLYTSDNDRSIEDQEEYSISYYSVGNY
ncbi:PIR Superfamily Protein [Plasmodium ovale curtisi]|uniref:PIR Superfamily Protein n=1 Tax=Plasmodium ovale curtisi TaxID=864141 RepID=A0A1A8XFB4_PLAOA|nr:PIR Superfamily Protein [Plasmodium ovale curtisi]